ncbi:hypothetical protein F4820DRAFT_411110 [Hypoxylon rubiginosum]|uniref:Uncharacterized protein n=1 Tax=Hypoxylon rubiginosum TaxID=110542 RepID=A0ACB9ZBN4_9PEZI|nr:hypothetical protein F4820DRAFT_411110 [Hypoxylon rubiginosum]
MDPPSVPPPPPPPPPLNIPPSRARLQLAARLAMHQKNAAATSTQSADGESSQEPDESQLGREPDSILRNPFEDDGEDDVDDDSDDGLGENDNNESWRARGSWWRGALRRSRERFGDGRDDSDSDKDEAAGADEDDEEFGDFAMPEVDKDGSNDKSGIIVKPLPVHPPSQSPKASAFSGLWPFGSKDKEKQKAKEEDGAERSENPSEITGDDGEKIKSTHEATRRTSIEDPDDEEVVV